ncbi:MAG: hypothetical protein ABI651_13330, partial [Verrucomicrobiota bacterium]
HLPDRVRLCVGPFALNVYPLNDPNPGEDMMAFPEMRMRAPFASSKWHNSSKRMFASESLRNNFWSVFSTLI